MGSIRKPKKHYETPTHPWTKSRIDEEQDIRKEYGLKNKTEIWRMRSKAKRFSDQAKKLIVASGEQAEREKEQMFQKLQSWGLLSTEANLDDVLSLDVRDILERRLQTQVYKKGLARSMTQARQFITHNHIVVGGRVVAQPSYIVPISEEESISFIERSSLADPEHPERQIKSESEVKKEAVEAAEGEEEPEEASKEESENGSSEDKETKNAEEEESSTQEPKKEEAAPEKTDESTEEKSESSEKAESAEAEEAPAEQEKPAEEKESAESKKE